MADFEPNSGAAAPAQNTEPALSNHKALFLARSTLLLRPTGSLTKKYMTLIK